MALPTVALPTGTVEIDGDTVPVRGLSRGEAMAMAKNVEDAAESEIALISHGLDTALADVREWYGGAPSHVVQKIVAKVMELSGLDGLGNE